MSLVGFESVISHTEALTNFSQKALNDSNQIISLVNSEITMMRKAVLQNCMALDIHTASQGGPCALIQTECCIYIPGESSNATYLMTHMKNQISALDDPLPSCGELLGRGFGSGSSWLKFLLVALVILLAVLLVVYLFYKIDDFCITWCITRPLAKLMIAKHLDSREDS